MLYVSFMEILPKSTDGLARAFGEGRAGWRAALGFFGGLALMGSVDALVPKGENPHELRSDAGLAGLKPGTAGAAHRGLWRMGLFTALAIGIHNSPEGMGTFLVALEDPRGGLAVAVAVALHNILEGVSVSVPIYYATGDRVRALKLSPLSGLAEPLGGVVAALTLGWLLPAWSTGIVFAGVAGVVVYISLDELLATARQFGKNHEVVAGITAGMAVMAASLLLLSTRGD
jgi:ZIP family zinc transporter